MPRQPALTTLLFTLSLASSSAMAADQPCSRCHSEIAKAYSATPMAITSGPVTTVPNGSFRHQASGVQYEIADSGLVQFSRGAATGKRQLDYYIGSGTAGRTYAYGRDGFLFEAPVTWYTRRNAWEASPGYEADTVSKWNRPIEPSCLFCHATQPQWITGTQNGYREPPFEHSGIACERCHGSGAQHPEGKASIVNPAKLDPVRRDSVCAQCHLAGEARIARVGKQVAEFRPGDRLSDFAAYFVLDDRTAPPVNSHVEKLAQSACKRSAGDRLACTSCHDPHRVPAAADRAAYFRGRCQTCHEPDVCKRGFDCASCHMPKLPASDIRHGVVTDHSIPRIPAKIAASTAWRLRGFSAADTGDRELGLAYAEVAARTGDPRQEAEAVRLVNTVKQDAEVKTRLAFLVEKAGTPERAAALYESALREAPDQVVAMVNLGRLVGTQGFLDRAIALWRSALQRNPCLGEAAMNLQIALRAKGDAAAADTVRRSQDPCIF